MRLGWECKFGKKISMQYSSEMCFKLSKRIIFLKFARFQFQIRPSHSHQLLADCNLSFFLFYMGRAQYT